MNDDELLQILAKAAREEREAHAADPGWARLTTGEADAGERAELEARAARDSDAARALALHRPLGEDAEARMAAAVLRKRAGPKVGRLATVRTLFFVAPPLAAAAALLLFLGRGGTQDVPDYALSFATTARDERALPTPTEGLGTTRLRPSSLLDVVVRPRETLEGAVEVRTALVRDGEARAWTPPLRVSEGGSVRISGRVADVLPPGAGSWDIVVAVGRPGSVPSQSELVASAARGEAGGRGYRVVRGRVEILAQ